jgi:hypothetical protein
MDSSWDSRASELHSCSGATILATQLRQMDTFFFCFVFAVVIIIVVVVIGGDGVGLVQLTKRYPRMEK